MASFDINQILGQAPTTQVTTGTVARANETGIVQGDTAAESLANTLGGVSQGMQLADSLMQQKDQWDQRDAQKAAAARKADIEAFKFQQDQEKKAALNEVGLGMAQINEMRLQGKSSIEIQAAKVRLYKETATKYVAHADDIAEGMSKLTGLENFLFSESSAQQEANRQLAQVETDQRKQLSGIGVNTMNMSREQITQAYVTHIAPIAAEAKAIEQSLTILKNKKELTTLQRQQAVEKDLPNHMDTALNLYNTNAGVILNSSDSRDQKVEQLTLLRQQTEEALRRTYGQVYSWDEIKGKFGSVLERADMNIKIAKGELLGADLHSVELGNKLTDAIAGSKARAKLGDKNLEFTEVMKNVTDAMKFLPDAQKQALSQGLSSNYISTGMVPDIASLLSGGKSQAGVSGGDLTKDPYKLAAEAVKEFDLIKGLVGTGKLNPQSSKAMAYRLGSIVNDPINGKSSVLMDNILPYLADDSFLSLAKSGELRTALGSTGMDRIKQYVGATLTTGQNVLANYEGQYTVSVDDKGLPIFTALPNGRISQGNLSRLQESFHNAAKAYANITGQQDVGNVMKSLIKMHNGN